MKRSELLEYIVGIPYLFTVAMLVYATGAVAMYNTPVPSWYGAAAWIVFLVPVVAAVVYGGVAVAKAVCRAKKPVKYGVIPSSVIVRALREGEGVRANVLHR